MADKKQIGRPRQFPNGTSPVTVRLPRETHDRLARAAVARNTSVARIIREKLTATQ